MKQRKEKLSQIQQGIKIMELQGKSMIIRI